MKIFVRAVIATLALTFIQACAAPPIQVNLNRSLGAEAVNKIMANKPCQKAYRLKLDRQSYKYEIKTRPENCCYPGLNLDWVFPIGKTLAAYLREAQKGQGGETIPLQFTLSGFRFVMNADSLQNPSVEYVKYKAHFSAPDPIGFLTIPESTYGSVPANGEDEERYDAIVEALRSTTVKLFAEVDERMCKS